MTMKINVNVAGNTAVISMSGRFDFNSHREFRSASEQAAKVEGVNEIEVDMNEVDYLDSSALGMLLLLREKSNAANRKLVLLNCKGMVQQVLNVANFGKLFTIK